MPLTLPQLPGHQAQRRAVLKAGAIVTLWPRCTPAATSETTPMALVNNASSSEHDFDFFRGHWRVHHRRLRQRLVGSAVWDEFQGRCSMRPLLDGFGNVDDNLLHLPDGDYRAVSLRSFNPKTRSWAIWWLDSRHPHRLDVPVIGHFKDGVGVFEAEDQLNGQPIRVRFIWSDTTSASPGWAQAFSADGGQTWETNWTMRFERISDDEAGDVGR